MNSVQQESIRYYCSTYAGRKKDCEAALIKASSDLDATSISAETVISYMWRTFGHPKETQVEGAIDNQRILGCKSTRDEANIKPSESRTDSDNALPALFPYPHMQFGHLSAIHLVLSAFAESTNNSSEGATSDQRPYNADATSITKRTFVGAAAIVFCSMGGSQKEAYLQLLWVDPKYRRVASRAEGPPLVTPALRTERIGSTLLELAMNKAFLEHKCIRFRLHTMVYRPLPQTLRAANATRESLLEKYFTTVPTSSLPAAGSRPCPAIPAKDMTEVVAKLYASFGFVERRYIQGYYECGETAAAILRDVASLDKDVLALRTDCIEMQADKRSFESALKKKQPKGDINVVSLSTTN